MEEIELTLNELQVVEDTLIHLHMREMLEDLRDKEDRGRDWGSHLVRDRRGESLRLPLSVHRNLLLHVHQLGAHLFGRVTDEDRYCRLPQVKLLLNPYGKEAIFDTFGKALLASKAL